MRKHQKPRLVISAINILDGGPLTVLKECVANAISSLRDQWEIIVLVHHRSLIEESGVTIIEFPASKRSWLTRLYYEWWHFNKLSKTLAPDIWLSLHDITPRIIATKQAVYCHNPAPFYRISLREAWLEPRFLLFNLFYKFLYGMFIERNRYVIVQQEWLRQEFSRQFRPQEIIVAHPVSSIQEMPKSQSTGRESPFVFFYPTFPRVFKNIEIIGKAARHLLSEGHDNFEIRVTVDGTQTRYTKWIQEELTDVPQFKLIGFQSRESVFNLYKETDCLLFPSKLETWGLPLSEFKRFGKPILAANLPYAHETVGEYSQVKFFDPGNTIQLAKYMSALMCNSLEFDESHLIEPFQPFAKNWIQLFKILTKPD
ncbi:MAG: glycosyltransferase [Proteobacteria bacterium]|nr:glycosyltransferase [Pseudomonadota bacterium]